MHEPDLKTLFEKKGPFFSVKARLSSDRLKLFLDVVPLENVAPSAFTRQDLIALLRPELAQAKCDPAVLDDIVSSLHAKRPVEKRKIAEGSPAKNGKDGKLLLLVKKYQKPASSAAEDHIDPRFVHFFDNVEKGTVLGRIYPSTNGENGYDALGTPLPAKAGSPIKVGQNDTILLSPAREGQTFSTLTANEAGYLCEEKEGLSVKSELVIGGNLDFSIGDIDFVGAVKVRGDVRKNFQVFARKDIDIAGNVLQARLVSREGSISVKSSVTGELGTAITVSEKIPAYLLTSQATRLLSSSAQIQIQAAERFSAEMINGVSVQTKGDVTIVREVRNSNIRTKGMLKMSQGHLFSSEVHAVCGVEAGIIGTALGSDVKIFLCSDIESSAEYDELLTKIQSHISAEEVLKLNLGPYAENPTRIQLLRKDLKEKMETLHTKLKKIRAGKAKLLQEQQDLLTNANYNKVFRVNYLKKLYQGVSVHVGEYSFTPDTNLTGPGSIEFLPDEKKFIVTDFKPLECVLEREKNNKYRNRSRVIQS